MGAGMTITEDTLAAAGWIKHDGKGMPVALDADVMVRYADMTEQSGATKWWRGWVWSAEPDTANHITHYLVPTLTPPAAPTPPDTLTLRDQFAMAALPALVAANVANFDPSTSRSEAEILADMGAGAYRIADAMLAERAKK